MGYKSMPSASPSEGGGSREEEVSKCNLLIASNSRAAEHIAEPSKPRQRKTTVSRWNHGVALPASPEEFYFNVVSPKGPEGLVLTLLADTFFGAINHWDGVPITCTGDPIKCYGCRKDLPRRWTGYIAAFRRSDRTRVIGQLTENAARQLLDIATENGTLRGVTVELRRRNGKKANAPVMVKKLGVAKPSDCMEEHAILPSLNRLWGLNLEKIMAGQDATAGGQVSYPLPPPPRPPIEEPDGPLATNEQWERFRCTLDGIGEMPN